MLRHLSHRTSQVRDLVFVRDAINRKEVMTTKDVNKDGTRTDNLSGPAVSFGYETNSSAQQDAGTNLAYHVSSPELIIPGLKAIQSPITSRSGQHERSGHRITGECKFYMPSMDFIRNQKEFNDVPAFDELETFDKLIDVERIIIDKGTIWEDLQPSPNPHTAASRAVSVNMSGYDVDRVQYKLRSSTTATVDAFQLWGYIGGTPQYLVWECDTAIDTTEYDVFDFPVRNVKNGDTTLVYIDGTAHTLTASLSTANKSGGSVNTSGNFDIDKMIDTTGHTNILSQVQVFLTGSESIDFNITLYKAAEWRIDSIKDYRDEYMEVRAVRVRGDRTSRRRADG